MSKNKLANMFAISFIKAYFEGGNLNVEEGEERQLRRLTSKEIYDRVEILKDIKVLVNEWGGYE